MSRKAKTPTPRKRSARNADNVWSRVIVDMQELATSLESGKGIPDGVVVRHVTLADAPKIPDAGQYNPKKVRAVREKVGASQTVFAKMVGVSPRLVCHWEQGLRTPAPIARRLLDVIQRDPKPWVAMLRAS